jgi:hypothetical protein
MRSLAARWLLVALKNMNDEPRKASQILKI